MIRPDSCIHHLIREKQDESILGDFTFWFSLSLSLLLS